MLSNMVKNDVQRFRCKDCDKTFNDRTMTPLANSHVSLEQWIDRFNGVATKYLPKYLHWFKWPQTFLDEKEIVKARQLLVNSSTKITDIKLKDYKYRIAIYI